MDDTLLKYDESLQALEKQRESLELVMKRMGAEWEESGAGIGWMGDMLSESSPSPPHQINEAADTSSYSAPQPSSSVLASAPASTSASLALKYKHQPLFHIMQSTAEPSHDYLQTLLNVNEELVAQSLASSSVNIEGEDATAYINSNTRDYNIAIASSLSSPYNNTMNAFVTQQQQQQNQQQQQQQQQQHLISPPLLEQEQHADIQSVLCQQKQSPQPPQAQLVTPPITPPEE